MKKIVVVLICVLFSSSFISAQENNEWKKNEIKLNLTSLLYTFPEIYYERILSNDQGVGASISFPISDSDTKFMFMPYYRVYFSKNDVSKFFIEANTALMLVKQYKYGYYYDYGYSSTTSLNVKAGLGFAVGYKYLNPKAGIVGEVYMGLGRSIGKNSDVIFYPRAGVAIGKLF